MSTDLFGSVAEETPRGILQQPEISPEVRQLLEQSVTDMVPKPNQKTKLVVDTETADEFTAKEKAEKPDPRIEIETTPQWDTEQVTDQENTPPWDVWTRMSGSLGKVVITDSDKTLFLKAAMHDVEVILPIEMPGGMVVRVKTLGNKTMRALSVAMLNDQKNGIITNDSLWITRLQFFSLVLQIAGVGDGSRGLMPEDFDTTSHTVNETADWLCEHVDAALENISGPRYALLVQAVRIFEAKIARCKEGLANGDFFDTADTSY